MRATALAALLALSVLPAPARAATLALDFEPPLAVADDSARQTARLSGMARAGRSADGTALGPPMILYEGGDAAQRHARIVADPTQPGNHVLELSLAAPNVALRDRDGAKGRVQMSVYGNRGAAEVYQRVRLRLVSGFAVLAEAEPFDWLTLAEWWNNAGWTGERWPMRIAVDIVNRDDADRPGLFLRARASVKPEADERWRQPLWQSPAAALPAAGGWMVLETLFREGGEKDGRFVMAITPAGGERRVVIDMTAPTRHPDSPIGDGLAHLNPVKLYTSGAVVVRARERDGALRAHFDDLQVVACPAAAAGQRSDCADRFGLR